jgi:hypothetical protein
VPHLGKTSTYRDHPICPRQLRQWLPYAIVDVAMTSPGNNASVSLHPALHATKPPEKITQEPFEGNDRHLRRLVRLKPGDRAESEDLWNYAKDLLYTNIQSSLLVYLLPFCLEAWRDDLNGNYGYGGFVEYLYPVLANRKIFDEHLSPEQAVVVSEFMKQSILEEIDNQRGLAHKGSNARPYRWIRALTTYGVLRPDIASLWTAWWSLETIGRAVAAVQYISCLMYPENENPVFAPWTPNGGGGPPSLWDFEGHLYEHCWLPPNIQFLKETLSAPTASHALNRCVERLIGQPEIKVATQLESDLPILVETLSTRCLELPRLLEVSNRPNSHHQWSV